MTCLRFSFSQFCSATLLAAALAATALGCAAETAAVEPEQDTTESPLKTKDHSAISGAACRANRLPEAFCVRVERETFNVDINEWTTLAAHAQPEAGQTRCEAAAAVQARLRSLGGEIGGILAGGSPSADAVNRMATALGRSLHTLQDNCAHNGMTNPQHAWYSVRDYCISSGESPDTQPGAMDCARAETAAAMRGFRDALDAAGIDPTELSSAKKLTTHNPGRRDACEFLREWKDFDGNDTRWDNGVTRPAFRNELVQSFTTQTESADLCGQGETLAVPQPRAHASVSDPFCITLRTFCIGY